MKTPRYPAVKRLASDDGALVRWRGFEMKLKLIWIDGEDQSLELAQRLVDDVPNTPAFAGCYRQAHESQKKKLVQRFKAILDEELEPPMKSPDLKVAVRFPRGGWIHLGSVNGTLDLRPLGPSITVLSWLNQLCTDRLDDAAEAWLDRNEEDEE
jgi:hypothetical protein